MRIIKSLNIYEADRDLSSQDGNPTSALQAYFEQIMSLEDPEEMVEMAISIVKPLVGKGMSEKNYNTFLKNLQKSAQRGIVDIQYYISNFILKGSGLGVVENKISAMAYMITEDSSIFVDLNETQQYLKELIENHTNFSIVILS
jgi:hypothetical protein